MAIISGLNNKAGKVIVIDESDWSVEANEDVTAQPDDGYEITVTAGQKLVVFRQSTGEIEAFGDVTAYEPPATSFVAFDNTFWDAPVENGDGSWDSENSVWIPDGNGFLRLFEIGDWATGYAPTNIRITYTGTVTDGLSIYNSGDNQIANISSLTSGETYDIDLSGSDIRYMDISSMQAFTITNIEFDVTVEEETYPPGEVPGGGPVSAWYDVTGPGYWESQEVVADSPISTWNSGNSSWVGRDLGMHDIYTRQVALQVRTGHSWPAGLRPTKIRVTFTRTGTNSNTLTVRDDSFNTMATGVWDTLASPAEIDFVWGGAGDIFNFQTGNSHDSLVVSKIELYFYVSEGRG